MNAYDFFEGLPDSLDEIEVMPGHQLCPSCLRQVTPERWDPRECACVECTHFDRLEEQTDARELEAARARLDRSGSTATLHQYRRRERRKT